MEHDMKTGIIETPKHSPHPAWPAFFQAAARLPIGRVSLSSLLYPKLFGLGSFVTLCRVPHHLPGVLPRPSPKAALYINALELFFLFKDKAANLLVLRCDNLVLSGLFPWTSPAADFKYAALVRLENEFLGKVVMCLYMRHFHNGLVHIQAKGFKVHTSQGWGRGSV